MNSYSTTDEAYYSLIDPVSMKGWVGLVAWLTYSGRLTHKVIIRPASSQAQDRESSPVKDYHCATPYQHSRFDSNSNRMIPIRFDSKVPSYHNFHKPRSRFNKKLQPLRRCSWDLFYGYDMILCLYSKSMYILASTVEATVTFTITLQRSTH